MLLQLILRHSGHACCVSSVASDDVGSRQGSSRRTRDFPSVFVAHTVWTEALHWMFCVVQWIKLFQYFTSSAIAQKNFPLLLEQKKQNKKLTIEISSHWIISYCSKWAHIVLVSNLQPCILIHIVSLLKTCCYTTSVFVNLLQKFQETFKKICKNTCKQSTFLDI